MRAFIRSFIALVVLAAVASSATAQSGSQGVFGIHNNTTNNIVVGFYTSDGGDWSGNWLSSPLYPGQYGAAEFYAQRGNCQQYFMVGWLGEDGGEVVDDPISIDICQASNVYLDDNEIYFD